MSVAVYFGGPGERIRLAKGCLEGIGIRVDGAVLRGEAGVREQQTSALQSAESARDLFRQERLNLAGRAGGYGLRLA